jgi:hypothetical protein
MPHERQPNSLDVVAGRFEKEAGLSPMITLKEESITSLKRS